MKMRMGFVSNSSSSSYIVLLTKEKFDGILETLTDFQKKVINLLAVPAHCFGQDMVLTEWTSGNYDTFEGIDTEKLFEGSDEDDDWDVLHEARDKFYDFAVNAGGFTHEIDG